MLQYNTEKLNIAKFGGTSMADFERMSSCADIVINNPQTRMVVVSASAGVTNYLVSLGNDELTESERKDITKSVQEISLSIYNKIDDKTSVKSFLDTLFDELESLAMDTEINDSLQKKDQLLSLGERMSSLLFATVLRQKSASAQVFDARLIMKTDSNFGAATPKIEAIKKESQKLKSLLDQSILVTQGFIGSDENSVTTTLGRGGSDYSASLLAEALEAKTCEIWTDVPGVYTTDPRITDKAKALHELSFEEAAEMATFGAKVLHPDTMIPALRNNIHVFVGSSFEPEKGGTWIMKDCVEEPHFRSISRRDDQMMVTFKIKKIKHSAQLLTEIFEVLASYNISIDLITMSETAVSMSIDNRNYSPWSIYQTEILKKLDSICRVETEENFNLITIVGNNLHEASGISAQIFGSIEAYSVRMICYGANPHNISFLVNKEDAVNVIKTLHAKLIEDN